ncbi:DUF3732 domain-containing protein [Paenibacillus chitinolyticus]|uniref:DUF3732 domain-containing protein n=1 Tax=Paenibacillus chitinolyticus TaxID=79263 RepID=UPI001C4780DE|nr:DUF3732 domain-containing protein [Paenibacillus chitinolyticus]MBV6714865.1 DUF3732 domain-containing protein [Paenibacillus chitinolyticus]
MRFVLKEIILWLKNGELRKLSFEANKVNVITGDSGTGKSVIIEIFDYCFFASKSKIPDEKINDNVLWYGVQFAINDKLFTLARGALHTNRILSKHYYFSPIGNIPEIPEVTMGEDQLKVIIEREFSIDSNVVIPYGGKKLKAGSKISFRYFFLFNTQSGDTIDHSEVFFDKLNDTKYAEALHRIFNLATGIDSVKNILVKEKIDVLEKEITRLEKKRKSIENEHSLYDKEIRALVRRAKEFDLIPTENKSLDDDIVGLHNLVSKVSLIQSSDEMKEISKLQKKRSELKRRIRTFYKFKDQYNLYKKLERENLDSLKPVEFIKENYGLLIKHPELEDMINVLSEEIRIIKKEINQKYPFDINVDSEIKDLRKELEKLEKEILKYPVKKDSFENEAQKYIFIGETKTKLEFYSQVDRELFDEKELTGKKAELTNLQEELEKQIVDKGLVIKLLEEFVQKYLDQSAEALGIYKEYKAVFKYDKKELHLKKPGALVPTIVGSSSNHMFMHICFMLGLHELIISQKAVYVPSFLLLDQPSRPYYGEEGERKNVQIDWSQIPQDDKTKITKAFKVLNDFIDEMKEEYHADFQIIVLEHIPSSIWVEANLNNVILVDKEFQNGNALIPEWFL